MLLQKTINPSTEEIVQEYPIDTADQIHKKVVGSKVAYLNWRKTRLPKRAELMSRAAQTLRSKEESLVILMAVEMGKPLAEGRSEIQKCAWVCEYYAENARVFLESQDIATDAARSFISFQPLGSIFAIMPWNFPFWQVFRFAAPTLMAGNVCLLKHAPNVTGCALAIESIFLESGFPRDVFQKIGRAHV